MKNLRTLVCLAVAVSILTANVVSQVPEKEKVITGAERAFEMAVKAHVAPGPGCAVGVSLNGESVFEKAFGLAEMEHNVPNTAQTIFESGSVAKQFVAAALVLLQNERKLSIDDPVRKYIPELPDYGSPLTIRHLLNHTAGLRDWGSVMALTGAGRGDRVITQAIALDVIYRQKGLDFKPGDEYSYSNSGYQLATEIVERVSKQKFSAFTEERFFKPLAMTKTSWRDDHQRIVPGRAQGYSRQGANAPWQLNMPFMSVYGNGGMLTTVGDWLKWNAMLDSRSMGGALVEALETRGILNTGKAITYALGLQVGTYRGLRDVSHGGSTAGYQTFLARYPDQKVSVAVLCNGTSPSAGGLAASVTDEIFGPFPSPTPASAPESAKMADEQLSKFVGLWRHHTTRMPGRFTLDSGTLRFNGNPVRPMADGAIMMGQTRIEFKADKEGNLVSGESTNPDGTITRFYAEKEWTPTPRELDAFAGDWYSEEAQATLTFAVEGNNAFLIQRPNTRLQLRPIYRDHFQTQGYVIWVTRDREGKIDRLHVGGSRMRDMFFERVRK
ncbi:MAG TPA: serine hydrolase domain-containing protein [Pyrinomonadaceae bacterium]|nr:serine hydrolase domain-containing protein [Pyrinomonadaceae bacterium]